MYNHLEGKLVWQSPTKIVLDVNGVGYEIWIPLSSHQSLPSLGERLRILTHHHVREDAHQLFGFLTEEERKLFRLLLGVSGIGPKSALTVLSGLEIEELKRAIIDENLVALCRIPGIGRKTAERIIIELREKVVVEARAAKDALATSLKEEEALVEDAISALISLGYRKQSAQEAVRKVLTAGGKKKLAIDELLRESLRVI